ncbi:unnamed protein product [Soboliphyme baturini]|uniref:Orange domain-containing protein n=1 Tax=Soboliphyme baturini TaxID=241478 RepID=A0A183IQK3_9BILA|nr:unnamed protein product [Soboliphyme baturini]
MAIEFCCSLMIILGLDMMAYDPQRFASDYHSMGFRECASEVARYLTSVEGMELHDPLRTRLISHLQYYCAQKLSAFSQWNPQHTASSSWVQNTQLTKIDSSSFPYSVPHSTSSSVAEMSTGNHFVTCYSSALSLPTVTCQTSSLNNRSAVCLSATEPTTNISSAMPIHIPPATSAPSISSLNFQFIGNSQSAAQGDSSRFLYGGRIWGE